VFWPSLHHPYSTLPCPTLPYPTLPYPTLPCPALPFHTLYFQAQDQAKAAIKGQYPLLGGTVQWILLIGPYWVPVIFGPFTEDELTVRAHKKESPSGDWLAQVILNRERDGSPRPLTELNLLCDDNSFARLEQIISATDALAKPLVNALVACKFQHLSGSRC
jgi:hypothetical protein